MYKITFQMATAISFIDPPLFDAIIAYAYAREQQKGKPYFTKQHYEEKELIDFSKMPIQKHKDGYFLASQMIYDKDKAVESVQRWRKRWHNQDEHLADFGKNKRKVDVQRGMFKSYDMPIRLISVPEVWFFFESDDIKEVARLITQHVFGIGKKRSVGHGEIRGFRIEKVENQKIIRPIPLRFLKKNKGGTVKLCTWYPPYWELSKAEICVISSCNNY